MAKLTLLVVIVLLATTVIAGQENCKRHGDPCSVDSQCCKGSKCHRYANRCQVQITPDELMAKRREILGHD